MRQFSLSDIKDVLPHRDYALFITNAVVTGNRVEGSASWNANHPHLAGHFPGLPLVPGIFLIEGAAQLVGIAVSARSVKDNDKLGVLAAVKKCLLHRPVRPDERINFSLELVSTAGGQYISASGTGSNAAAQKVVTVEITVAIVERAAIAEGA